MITIHPNILERDGKKAFVVLPYEEFLMIQEELQEYEDLKELRAAKAEEEDAPTGGDGSRGKGRGVFIPPHLGQGHRRHGGRGGHTGTAYSREKGASPYRCHGQPAFQMSQPSIGHAIEVFAQSGSHRKSAHKDEKGNYREIVLGENFERNIP